MNSYSCIAVINKRGQNKVKADNNSLHTGHSSALHLMRIKLTDKSFVTNIMQMLNIILMYNLLEQTKKFKNKASK